MMEQARRAHQGVRGQRLGLLLRTLGVAIGLPIVTSCATARMDPVPASNPDAKEWIELFNGRNLDGWIAKIAKHDVGDNYANTFRVVDGVIQARYDGYGGNYNAQFGHLYYEKPYSYYIISADYRFSGELYPGAPSYTLRNSGIMMGPSSSMIVSSTFMISLRFSTSKVPSAFSRLASKSLFDQKLSFHTAPVR